MRSSPGSDGSATCGASPAASCSAQPGAPRRSERIALLEEALAVAKDAGDRARQTAILTRLVETRWSQGDRHGTLVALDRLAAVGGADAAAEACPPELTRCRCVGAATV